MNNNDKAVTTVSSVGELLIGCDTSSNLDALVIKNYDRWRKKAFKNAWKRTMEKFIEECSILGLQYEDFEILSWKITEEYPKIDRENTNINNIIFLDVSFKRKE